MAKEVTMSRKKNIQKFEQENTLATISSIVLDQSQRHVIDVHTRSTEETAMDIEMKKSALSLAMNLKKISKFDKEMMVQKGIEEEKIKAEEEKEEEKVEEEMATILDMKSKKFLQGEKLIIYKKRGSFFNPRPSIFPSPSIMETETIDTSDKLVDDKKMLISEGSMIERSVDEDPSTILTRYEATAIASVLEECVDQLAVLQHAIPAEIDDRWDDIVKPIKEKYGALEEPHIIIREETNLPPLILSKAAKLQRDRTYMYKILKMTLDEIKRYQKFDILKEEVNDIMKMLEDEYNLKETCMFWENQVNQLRQLIKDETNKQEREKRQLLKLAQMTKAKVDDTVYEMALKMGYVNKWENARFTQHLFKLTTEEQNLLNEIDEYRKKQIVEKIVTEKICAYYQESIKDMENEMLTWSNRYDDEIEQRQRDINDLKTKIEEQKLEIQDLRIMKDERQAFIDENLAEIRRLEEEAKYQAILHRAATIIQAAIRGYFVRHELGEYKNLRAQLRKRKKLAAAKRRKLEAQRKKLEEEEMKKLKDTRLKTGKIK